MRTSPEHFEQCRQALRGALRTNLRTRIAKRLTGKTDAEIEAVAFGCMSITAAKYAIGIRDVAILRDEVRKTMQQEYGSIVVMILFTIIWEIIKQWLFDQ